MFKNIFFFNCLQPVRKYSTYHSSNYLPLHLFYPLLTFQQRLLLLLLNNINKTAGSNFFKLQLN